MTSRLHPLFLDTKGLDLQQLEAFGNDLVAHQKGVMWWLGDCAKAAEARFPDTWEQAFPAEVSPGLIQRAKAVARAYPREEDRNPQATWTQHMTVANKPNRIELVAAMVSRGETSDESRKTQQAERNGPRWLLAFDVHYFTHRHFYSGAGVETATQVAGWVQRTVERLKAKGATDCVCAFEGVGSFRKDLTAEWEGEHYKDRPPKPEDLKHQLRLVRNLLGGHGFLCVSVDGYEADDVLASYATQFRGRTTIVTSDKDLRQVLSDHCNILLDVEWVEDETTGDLLPQYQWLSAKQHTEATGIRPDQWPSYQVVMGDNTDGVKGVPGIGEKGAADLIREFGSVEAAIEAAKAGDERIKEKKRDALIEFEPKLEVTRKLVTLVTDLPIPGNTRI